MRAGAKAGERPARWSESQESVNPDGTRYTFPLSGTSARSAETRIHGTTKRQVVAMFYGGAARSGVAVPIPLMQPLLILALELVAALQIEVPTDLILTPVSRDQNTWTVTNRVGVDAQLWSKMAAVAKKAKKRLATATSGKPRSQILQNIQRKSSSSGV